MAMVAEETGHAAATAPVPDVSRTAVLRTPLNVPLWSYVALGVAVIAMSSGGVWFALLPDTPPILKAGWRLLATAVLQLPGFARDYHRASAETRLRWRGELPLLLSVGAFALAPHFALWSWSIEHTSLTHSLLFVSATPLVLVVWYAMRWAAARPSSLCIPRQAVGAITGTAATSVSTTALPPTFLELFGTAVGFAAAALLAAEAGSGAPSDPGATPGYAEPAASLVGDGAALLGAVVVAIYLVVGRRLRAWMPVFLYACPVTGAAGVAACAVSMAFEPGAQLEGLEAGSLFGWLGSWHRFGITLGAALGPGILGHTLVNLTLIHINPLIVSVMMLLEPVSGSLIGYAVGVQGVPGTMTLLAGPVLLVGAALVTLGARGEDGQSIGDARCAEATAWLWAKANAMTWQRLEAGRHEFDGEDTAATRASQRPQGVVN